MAETSLNADSSRGHCVFDIHIWKHSTRSPTGGLHIPLSEGEATMGVAGVLCLCVIVCAHDRELDLSYNRINGSFPSVVSGLSSLT